jgi:ATP-dependent DNA helicase RecG
VISGKVELFDGKRQMNHPDHIAPLHQIEDVKRVEPVYPQTEGLSTKVLDKAIRAALIQLPDLPEWADPAYLARRGWPSWKEALIQIHSPGSDLDLLKSTCTVPRASEEPYAPWAQSVGQWRPAREGGGRPAL